MIKIVIAFSLYFFKRHIICTWTFLNIAALIDLRMSDAYITTMLLIDFWYPRFRTKTPATGFITLSNLPIIPFAVD